MTYHRLDYLKQKLDSHRLFPAETISNLHEDLVLRWTYNSNAIEGNTITLKETRFVLEYSDELILDPAIKAFLLD